MFKQPSRGTFDPASLDPLIYVRNEARRDPRIGRAWRDGKLIYCALVGDDLVESQDILEVYDRLPDLDAA